jgi:hypothetical protein
MLYEHHCQSNSQVNARIHEGMQDALPPLLSFLSLDTFRLTRFHPVKAQDRQVLGFFVPYTPETQLLGVDGPHEEGYVLCWLV